MYWCKEWDQAVNQMMQGHSSNQSHSSEIQQLPVPTGKASVNVIFLSVNTPQNRERFKKHFLFCLRCIIYKIISAVDLHVNA